MRKPTKNDIILLAVVVALVALGLIFLASESANAPTGDTGSNNNGEICAQVITPARNPETGEVVEFPTPCDVPDGWEVIR